MADNDKSLKTENQKPFKEPATTIDQPTIILAEEESKTSKKHKK